MKKLVNMKYALLMAALFFTNVLGLAQEAVQSEVITQSRPMYERFGMTSSQLFILMLSVTLILVIVTISLALNLRKVLDFRIKKNIGKGTKIGLLLIGLFLSTDSFAAETYQQQTMEIPFPDSSFWIFVAFDLFLVLVILYLVNLMNSFLTDYLPARKPRFWSNFQKTLVDATPIEDEKSILLDHDYDGIKELDNNLPPWWKYGFYITIVWAVGYFIFYTIPGGGQSQEEEFLSAMENGEREVAEYKAAHPELVTEETAQVLTDAATLSLGSSIFNEKCVTCHMQGGAGGAGPNLTDDYWIYGNTVDKIFHTVSEGANNGMKSWKNDLNGIEIQAVASYILQLDPILPPQGQEPKGDFYPPEE